jgi:methanogenic corrinoid protein MtbC1
VVTNLNREPSEDALPIGSVVDDLRQTYPDVSHSSLRFLEREGLIAPIRTPGGHRLFTPENVARIRRIKEWQAQHLSLAEIRDRLAAASALNETASVAAAYLHEAINGDFAAATRLVLRADDSGVSLSRIFGEVLMSALYEVGQRWARGELAVGQEKEISELTRDVVAELSRRHADADPLGPIVVAACVAGEHHDLGLRMIIGLLRARGWRIHFLGADVATRFLVETVVLRNPDVVLLSATTAERLDAIKDVVVSLRALDRSNPVPVVVGGLAVAIHGDALAAMGVTTADGLDAVLSTLQGVGDQTSGDASATDR